VGGHDRRYVMTYETAQIDFDIDGIECIIDVTEYVSGSGDIWDDSADDCEGYVVYDLLTKRGKSNKRLDRLARGYEDSIMRAIENYFDK
jgi:hypothetical protein